MVTNLDGDPQDFADVIQAWENVYAGEMARAARRHRGIHRAFRRAFRITSSPRFIRRATRAGRSGSHRGASHYERLRRLRLDASWPRLRLDSFRAKFVLVVGGAVLFDLLVSGGVALWNVNRLSQRRDAADRERPHQGEPGISSKLYRDDGSCAPTCSSTRCIPK